MSRDEQRRVKKRDEKFFFYFLKKINEVAGFEPAPVSIRVKRLNHSAITTTRIHYGKDLYKHPVFFNYQVF